MYFLMIDELDDHFFKPTILQGGSNAVYVYTLCVEN